MTDSDIVTLCRQAAQQQPTTIYFAIGCALGRYAPGEHPHQQYPPFMAAIPGCQICILMDPDLESPPRAVQDLTGSATPDQSVVTIQRITFIPVRRYFEWDSDQARIFIDQLCTICMVERAHLIVQDYAGNYIEQHYPIDRFGPDLTKRVLFDVTYRDGGCFIDLNAVRILKNRDGSFIQPKYDVITLTRSHLSREQLRYVLKERRSDLVHYIKRFHRLSTGAEEPRDWCVADIVLRRMQTLCHIYRVTPEPSIRSMEQLMSAYLFDLCTAVGDRVTEETANELIRSPTKDYENMLLGLEELLLETGVKVKEN